MCFSLSVIGSIFCSDLETAAFPPRISSLSNGIMRIMTNGRRMHARGPCQYAVEVEQNGVVIPRRERDD